MCMMVFSESRLCGLVCFGVVVGFGVLVWR